LFLILLVPGCFFAIFLTLLASPYHLFYYSSNWGLSEKHFEPIQLYLDHFESLYPNLIAWVSGYLQSETFRKAEAPRSVRFWPTLTKQRDIEGIPLVLMIRTTRWSFSVASGLFMLLENSGFRRRTLLDFLETEVESKVPTLTEQEKQDFRRVKEKVCNHNIFDAVASMRSNKKDGFVLPDRGGAAGDKIIPVTNGSIDWIVDGSHPVIVPMDSFTYYPLQRLASTMVIFQTIKKDEDTNGERSGWQALDLR
jgi:hypothetical protein